MSYTKEKYYGDSSNNPYNYAGGETPPLPDNNQAVEKKARVSNCTRVNFRRSPSYEKSNIITTLAVGEEVVIVDDYKNHKFIRVKVNFLEHGMYVGYIDRRYLEMI